MCCEEAPGAYVLRQELAIVEYFASYEWLQLEMMPNKYVLKLEEGHVCLKLQTKSLLNLVKRRKIRPRIRKPAAVHRSPYRHSYLLHYQNSRLNSYNRR